jgi:hypothetical protein
MTDEHSPCTAGDYRPSTFTTERLRRVHFGARLLFWTLLLAPLATNLLGFALPFVEGDLSHLRWTGLIWTLAALPTVIGVFALTFRAHGDANSWHGDRLRIALRILVCLEVIGRVTRKVSQFTIDPTDTLLLSASIRLVEIAAVLLGIAYLARISRQAHADRLERSWRTLAMAYVLAVLLDLLIGRWGSLDPSRITPTALGIAISIAVWVWGLVLLWRFGVKLADALAGRCLECGYLLQGLPEPRCPECGRAFSASDSPPPDLCSTG